ncbi:hypothetical protein KFK09_021239 [Dendrobium nobile]|uniref:CBS domain-containing protein n=1 Tax=Dendrobium nobile TaxID=94219 RepID=A0A8T3APL7_DENNO|nr:hypothetical protein KFK09_021239 [Dendrobium nobile]
MLSSTNFCLSCCFWSLLLNETLLPTVHWHCLEGHLRQPGNAFLKDDDESIHSFAPLGRPSGNQGKLTSSWMNFVAWQPIADRVLCLLPFCEQNPGKIRREASSWESGSDGSRPIRRPEELKSLSLRGPAGGSGRGGGILLDEDDEAVRFANVRKNDFKHLERVKGRLINILDGLQLHTGIFSAAERGRIVGCVYDFLEKGRKGRLRGIFIVFLASIGTCNINLINSARIQSLESECEAKDVSRYSLDSNGNPLGIIRDEEVDPIPPLLKQMIKRMVAWHVLPPSCIPNSCIVNIYDKDDCIPPHI